MSREISLSCELPGTDTIHISTGLLAKQASGSVVVQAGETVVLVAATGTGSPRAGIDFFPLTCDYREHHYAAGKIPGGFFKRAGRPTTKETLGCRLMDRPIRPLFPDGYKCEVQVQAYVLSFDNKNAPEPLAIVGASAALHLSDIPFEGPLGAVRMGLVDGEFIYNLSVLDEDKSDLELMIAGTADAVAMVEAGAKIVPEDTILEAIQKGHEAIKNLCAIQEELRSLAGKPKAEFVAHEPPAELRTAVEEFCRQDVRALVSMKGDKISVYGKKDEIKDKVKEHFAPQIEDGTYEASDVSACLDHLINVEFRRLVIEENSRPDGRGTRDIRPITVKPGFLPRTHGSCLFTRGETQALGTVTFGVGQDEQIIDGLEDTYREHFILHYNFPPFSVGECRPIRGPGRREIGHGQLAHRALLPVLPDKLHFPYTIRVVSEILESNGSSSMATVCSGSVAMMDAAVPIKASVGGVAMGLVAEGGRHAVLTDIQGWEDHYGDMDFKVAGTREGITALQMDIKVKGLSIETMREAMAQAREARLSIIDTMEAALPKPRTTLSPHAPRILSIPINPDKIGAVIGPGGKTIRHIQETYKVRVEIDDENNQVLIVSTNEAHSSEAEKMVRALTEEPEVGKIYEGKVVRITRFGCFVEILPGQDGLCHVSNLDTKRVEYVEDFCKIGDIMPVKLINIDEQGRLDLSRKEALIEIGETEPEGDGDRADRRGPPNRREGGPRRGRGGRRPPRRDGGGKDGGGRRDGGRREGGRGRRDGGRRDSGGHRDRGSHRDRDLGGRSRERSEGSDRPPNQGPSQASDA